MKVGILTTGFLRHKTDTRGLSVYEIAKNLVENKIQVEVIAPHDKKTRCHEFINKIEVTRFNYFPYQNLAYGAGIPTNIKKSFFAKIQLPFFILFFISKSMKRAKNWDIIHAQWILSGLAGIVVGFFYNKPVFLTIRRIVHENYLMKRINKFVIEHVDFVFFNSNYTMAKVLEFAKPKNHKVLHPTVDVHKFMPLKTNLKKRLGINKKIIFSLGLLVEKKGFKYLIKAMKYMDKKLSSQSILLIGGHGPEESELKKLVNDLNLDNVRFTGEINSKDTPKYFNAADVFVLPSIVSAKGETETFGVVLIEALACGCPVIASNVGGIPDIVTPNVGFLVEQKNIRQIAEKLNVLLSDDNLRREMSKNARKKVLNEFNSDNIAEELIKSYKTYKNVRNMRV